MKKKLLLIVCALSLLAAALACNLPLNPRPAPEPTPTPDYGMVWYQGEGMQMLLPYTYAARNIQDDIPGILAVIRSFIGEGPSPLSSLVENLEGNVAWWGYDAGAPAVSPVQLLVIKNESLEKTPVSLISTALRLFLGKNAESLQTSSYTINKRNITRFSYADDNNGWQAYAFKEQGRLWIALFITPPANLAAQQVYFDYSVNSMLIDPLQETPQP
ncbi:MAG TPA: hypothetical protein PLH68_01715 [Anaerolineaceae bacterium]|nr:hypothetical protein [Anaerolineaceae bacterium]